MWRTAVRFSSAVLLSMGPKNPTAPTPSPRARARYRIQNLRARGRGRRSRTARARARLAGSGGFAALGARGAVPVDLAHWKAGDAARDRPRSRLAASRADAATKGGRYKPGAGGAVARGGARRYSAMLVMVIILYGYTVVSDEKVPITGFCVPVSVFSRYHLIPRHSPQRMDSCRIPAKRI